MAGGVPGGSDLGGMRLEVVHQAEQKITPILDVAERDVACEAQGAAHDAGVVVVVVVDVLRSLLRRGPTLLSQQLGWLDRRNRHFRSVRLFAAFLYVLSDEILCIRL